MVHRRLDAAVVRVQCKNYSYYIRTYTGGRRRYETAYYDVDDLKKKKKKRAMRFSRQRESRAVRPARD